MNLSAINEDGYGNTHWLTSTIIFSLIINLVCFKLFIETNFWNPVSLFAGIFSLAFYYIVLAIGQTKAIAEVFQPELEGIFT